MKQKKMQASHILYRQSEMINIIGKKQFTPNKKEV